MIMLVVCGAILAVGGFFFGREGRAAERDGYMPEPPPGERVGLGIRREQDFVRYWRRSMAFGWLGVGLIVLGAIGLLVEAVV